MLHRRSLYFFLLVTSSACAQNWPQWGQNPQHSGSVSVPGQFPNRILADIVFDPFVAAEQADSGGDLLAHYQAPLVDGDDVFMLVKTGRWVPCNPPGSGTPSPCGADAWNAQIWNEARFHWENGALVEKWRFASDWKPPPVGAGWEPVFHPVLAGAYVYVPGAGGTVYKLNRADGSLAARIVPLSPANQTIFVAGPLTADAEGNVFYNAVAMNSANEDVAGAWLVKIDSGGNARSASFQSLVVGAPGPRDACFTSFNLDTLPWPPAPNAVPPQAVCGSQRPGVNVAPAIAPDGTVYTISRAHFNSRYAYLVAVNPDLTPKWTASLRDRLNDGCGVLLPPNGQPGGCRDGARFGVDPATNQLPAGRVIDQSSSSPVVAPDGSVLYGAITNYNYGRGHLFHFSAAGAFLNSYDFGWDTTPAIYSHGGTYSVVLKDNHYDVGSYCANQTLCPADHPGPYLIMQLDAALRPEWSFGGVAEWCINAPAVDVNGRVYANSEDGNLYVLGQGGHVSHRLFLKLAVGAAYTPLSIGLDGKIYAENDGHLFVIGERPRRGRVR